MNSFGRFFRVHIFGESHGNGLGVCIDGCPAGIPLSANDFSDDLLRRKSGAKGTTPRLESDEPEFLSGIYNGFSTGAPVAVLFRNENTRSADYRNFSAVPRPGHADFTANKKFYGFNDPRGGGHFSGRITLGLVVAGVIAKKIIAPANVFAKLLTVGGSSDIHGKIDEAISERDSVGGLIQCTVSNLPAGLGSPFFDGLESVMAHVLFSIPGVKGVEFGAGFAAAGMKGSEHNDVFISTSGKTLTNNAGGINGGISNGNDITLNVAVKPTASIGKEQSTFNFETQQIEIFKAEGRHDVCIALRVPVIVEAAVAVAIADFVVTENNNRFTV
ncbi:MAG: chorismate synthase [Prevotellaceae bacterium]|jgi:chorismate synthase|nr:chorismate synthase [Prevotellaceae bacterium]